MSYRDESQELETPIQQILDGIKVFNDRVNNRIESNDWETGHILKLNRIRKDLLDMQLDLEEVKRETW